MAKNSWAHLEGHRYFDGEDGSCAGQAPPKIHETAIVEYPCEIGFGTTIMQYTHVMANSLIGYDCTIHEHVTLSPGVLIGNHVELSANVHLISGVIMEDNVFCGTSSTFETLQFIRAGRHNVSSFQPSVVKTGAIIGPNATISAGFTIGKHAFIEAGSVVDQHIPNYAIIQGNPCNLIGWRCACGNLLKFIFEQTTCQACNFKYKQRSDREIAALD